MSKKRRVEEYVLFLVIGSLYAFAVNLAILNTTILEVSLGSLFVIGIVMLLLLALVFLNKYTMVITLGFLVIFALGMFYFRDSMEGFWYFVNEIILLARGYLAFRADFIWPVVLAVCFLTALFITVCLYVNFHFYLLAGFGAAIFIVCWVMDYPQTIISFIIYLFCFCVFLVRKLQGPLVSGGGARVALITAPLCAAVVWLATLVPVPTAYLDHGAVNRFFNEPWEVVSEFFFLAFNPKYFSFQTTGFGGQGGRLGGPVSPNHRPVMAVEAPRRIYLSGATHNIYTGYGWRSDANEFIPADGRIHPSYIEFMETATSLFRNTSRIDLSGQWNYDLTLTTYLPLSHADIFIGNNRTGSLFRPMRERGIQFDDPALHDILLVNASGDRRLEELIPRNSVYRYNFLDIDYRDEHIQGILRSSRRGLYRERLERTGSFQMGNLQIGNRQANLYINNDIVNINIWYNDEILGWAVIEQINPDTFRVHAFVNQGTLGNMNLLFTSLIVGPDQITVGPWDKEGFDNKIFYITYNNVSSNNESSNNVSSAASEGTIEIFNRFDAEGAATLVNLMAAMEKDTILAEYADFVYENYMQLPDTLPQRVIDLAHDIVRYYNTDYERIRALQEFLIQFPYTLLPDPVPHDRDFVDYFLFDGQEGYCVYYATAMVVMTRAIGIPARYAEGFLLPAHRDQETGMFSVTNRNAHAWAEVYLEGFGWLIVETTAPYVFAMYERPFIPADIFAWGFMDWANEDYLWQAGLWYAMHGMYTWGWEGEEEPIISGLGTATAEQAVQIDWRYIIIAAAIAVPGLLVIYLGMWHILWAARIYKLRKMSPTDQIISYYHEILKITEHWSYPILDGETPYTYTNRLRYRFAFVNNTVFLRDLNDIYYRARYGQDPLTEKEAEFMKSCYRELSKLLWNAKGPLGFLYIRYFKGVIAL